MTVEVKCKITGIKTANHNALAFSEFNGHSPHDKLQTPQSQTNRKYCSICVGKTIKIEGVKFDFGSDISLAIIQLDS